MKMLNLKPIHIVIRYADTHLSVDDTIARHQDVLNKNGAVWFGKIGKPLGEDRIQRVNEQVEAGMDSCIYLVRKSGPCGDYLAYRCRVIEMSSKLPERQKKFIPSYYDTHGITDQVSLWTKVSSIAKIDSKDMKKLHVASSRRPLLHTLVRSMAGMFVVQDGEGDIQYA